MAFVANLFNTHPGFEKALANGADGSDLSDLADSQRREETREEKSKSLLMTTASDTTCSLQGMD